MSEVRMAEKEILSADEISIEVIIDNFPCLRNLQTSWGFSCVVRGTEKTMLFDTGGNGHILISNMGKLRIDPKIIDLVFLSHDHYDHTGGLDALVAINPKITIYLPQSFPQAFKSKVQELGSKVVEVGGSIEVGGGVFSTGELGNSIVEQSLVLRTDKGLILITGCAHPGIVSVIEHTKEMYENDKVLLVMGGMHLRGGKESWIKSIIADFKRLGVVNVGICHCSGDHARTLFKEEYGKHYFEIGVGASISHLSL